MTERAPYKTDLTDAKWRAIEGFMPDPASTGRPREVAFREVINTILYQLKTGCQWEMLLHDLVNPSTAFSWFQRFEQDGTWAKIHEALRKRERARAKKKRRRRRPSSTARR